MSVENGTTRRHPTGSESAAHLAASESHEMAERGQVGPADHPHGGATKDEGGVHYFGHHGLHTADGRTIAGALREDADRVKEFWIRFTGRNRWVTFTTSIVNIVRSSSSYSL
jgi:hypothetical protein